MFNKTEVIFEHINSYKNADTEGNHRSWLAWSSVGDQMSLSFTSIYSDQWSFENTLLRNLAKHPPLALEHLVWDLTMAIYKVHNLRQVT